MDNRITTIIEEKIKDKPKTGRPRIPFTKQVIEDTGIRTYRELKITVSSTGKQKDINHYLSNLQIEKKSKYYITLHFIYLFKGK